MGYSANFRGAIALGPSSGNATGYQSGSGSIITMASPVSTNSIGQVVLTDVSSETSINSWVGLVSLDLPSAANGDVFSEGRLQNIPLSLGFAVGDPLWVGIGGTLTNVKPDLTVSGWIAGYWVLFVGVVVANQFTTGQQDIQLFRQKVGQL